MYLASQSPRRRQLLEAAGFSLTIVPADIDETRLEGETPSHLVERLACEKAEATRLALAGKATDNVLLAADTRSFVETTRVSFFDLTDEEIRAYVASGEPMDKAGAYGIQGRGRLLVSGIEGDWANVVGLPVARVVRELEAFLGRRDLVARCLGAEG